jgi:hypothetical protein
MAEDIKEYGVITLDVEDNIQENKNQKMKKIKLTTDPNDKLYLNEDPRPEYYLPFYIPIFQKPKRTIKAIRETKLTELFTKKFTDFITITLKQQLTPKTCVNFIKDKSLVQRFITEYKSKNPSTEGDKYNSYDVGKYKTFIENVYVFFIRILATEAGSFLYKYKDASDTSSSSDSDSATLETKNKKLYHVKLLFGSNYKNDADIYKSINDFIDQTNLAKKTDETAAEKKLRELKNEILHIDEHIHLSILKNNQYQGLTKTILDSYFKSKEDKILKEKSYDFKTELDYNKLLKDIILDKLVEKELYRQNVYDSKLFTKVDEEDKEKRPILNQLTDSVNKRVDDLNKLQKESAIIKNSSDIKNDIITAIKVFYIEKEKNIQKREKKIYITITLIKGSQPTLENTNLELVDLTKITSEGAPTFSDIEKFQKKLQEDISKYIKSCQNPKDIQSKVEKECNEICTSDSETVKNKLWCSICTNYIKCVYNQPNYNNDTELQTKKEQKAAKKKAEEEKAAKEKAEEEKAAAEKAEKEAEAAKKESEKEKAAKEKAEAAKKKAEKEAESEAEAAKKKAEMAIGGGVNFSNKKTISKKQLQLFKPNRKVSIKLH